MKNCPRRDQQNKDREKGSKQERSNFIGQFGSFAQIERDYSFLAQRDGVWGILDIGATRTVGSVGALERLQIQMLQDHDEESYIIDDKPNFVFGNGESKTAVGTQESSILLASAHRVRIRLAALDADVPILTGTDVMSDLLQMVVDVDTTVSPSPPWSRSSSDASAWREVT